MSRFPRQLASAGLLVGLLMAACGGLPPSDSEDAGSPDQGDASLNGDAGAPEPDAGGADAGEADAGLACPGGEDPGPWYLDCDGDLYGHLGEGLARCGPPDFHASPPEEADYGSFPEYRAAYRTWAGEECRSWGIESRTDDLDPGAVAFVIRGGDCDERVAAVHPDAPESCDGIDNNCDGAVDVGEGGEPIHPYCISAFEGICDLHSSQLVTRPGASEGYFFCTGRLGWQQAEDLCQVVEGGHLLRLRSIDEDMAWLRGSAEARARIRPGQPVWLGLRDLSTSPEGSPCAHDLRWVGDEAPFDAASPYWGAADGAIAAEPDGCGQFVAYNAGRRAEDGAMGALVDAPEGVAFTFICERPL